MLCEMADALRKQLVEGQLNLMDDCHEKPNATKWEDFRTITLISHAAKMLLKVLPKRIEAKVNTIHFLSDGRVWIQERDRNQRC